MAQNFRRIFWYINKYLMVPLFRMGLGPLMGNPFSGYIMIVKTVGRKTGKMRFSPVNYAIQNGCIYCLAGFGQVCDWYRNLRANPQVELILPGRSVSGAAVEVLESPEYLLAARQVLKNGGFAGFFMGFNPYTVSDAILKEKMKGIPMTRIQPTGLGAGPYDAGGGYWIVAFALFSAILYFTFRS